MDARTKPMYSMFLLLSGGILALILYYYAYPFWAALGLRSGMTDSLMLDVHRAGVFRSPSAPSALETYAADKPLHKSHGSTDSVIWAVRTSSFLPKRQRLFHRRASHRPAVR